MSDTDETAVWDGTAWEGLNRSRDRNVIINGAMQIHQRGTSTAGITSAGYYSADRFALTPSSLGTWTQSTENDGPTGSGFRKSSKILCTTADASPAASDFCLFRQYIEGQNLQAFAKGTPSAKQFTLSFWVKSNLPGGYVATLEDLDNSRIVSASYTITSSGTWEKKIISFPADKTGQFDNDNNAGLLLNMWLAAGSNYVSSALQTSWGAPNWTNGTSAGGQVNLASAANNYWQITGVQLEAGSVATPFEFEAIETTLRKCQRYFLAYPSDYIGDVAIGFTADQTSWGRVPVQHPVIMRGSPTLGRTPDMTKWRLLGRGGGTPETFTSITIDTSNASHTLLNCNKAGMSTNQIFTLRPASSTVYESIWLTAEF
jgi:hypothetical protein